MKSKKYYISVDLEGVACTIGSYGKGLAEGTAGYNFAAAQGTREAAAAAQALLDGGAQEVVVWDCHGSGFNLDYRAFDPRVRFVLGAGSRKRFPGLDESFAGVLFIGYHAYDTPDATLCHVYSSSSCSGSWINGEPVGELQIDAAIAGKQNVPVLFVSSDDVCVAQAKKSFPDAVTVETKQALAWNSCISKHPDAVCEEIREQVRAAMNAKGTVYRIQTPFTYEVAYKRIEYAQGCALRNPDNTPFARKDAYTRVGTLNDPEHIFEF